MHLKEEKIQKNLDKALIPPALLVKEGDVPMQCVFLYVRVSTEEQAIHGLSIEAQSASLKEWAKRGGYRIVDTYIDAGISARKPASKRPELQRLKIKTPPRRI